MVDPAHPRSLKVLLNLAHALDPFFLLIFATAVAASAADFGFPSRANLMPWGVGAPALCALPDEARLPRAASG